MGERRRGPGGSWGCRVGARNPRATAHLLGHWCVAGRLGLWLTCVAACPQGRWPLHAPSSCDRRHGITEKSCDWAYQPPAIQLGVQPRPWLVGQGWTPFSDLACSMTPLGQPGSLEGPWGLHRDLVLLPEEHRDFGGTESPTLRNSLFLGFTSGMFGWGSKTSSRGLPRGLRVGMAPPMIPHSLCPLQDVPSCFPISFCSLSPSKCTVWKDLCVCQGERLDEGRENIIRRKSEIAKESRVYVVSCGDVRGPQ